MKPQPVITVKSVNGSAAFYCAILGAERGHVGDDYAQILWGGDMIMQLHDFSGDDDHPPLGNPDQALGNGVTLWFETDDFVALIQRIVAHDIPLDREMDENPYSQQMEAWLHDPDGYQVVIAGPSLHPRVPVSN